MRKPVALLFGAFLLATVAGCGGSGAADTPPAAESADTVLLNGRLYAVSRIVVPSGSSGRTAIAFYRMNNKAQLIGTAPNADSSVFGYLYANESPTMLPVCAHETVPTDINDAGQIVGTCRAAGVGGAPDRGFLTDGTSFRTIEFPSEAPLLAGGTSVSAVNGASSIVGSYAPLRFSSPLHGFMLLDGTFTEFDPPGATATFPEHINRLNQIVGHFADGTGALRGFLWDQGRITVIDVPGATWLYGLKINASGQVVGTFLDADKVSRGFLWDQGRLVVIEVPGATATSANAINASGLIVGAFRDVNGTDRGYLWERGRIATIEVPDATAAVDINDGGQILGPLDRNAGGGSYLATPIDAAPGTTVERN